MRERTNALTRKPTDLSLRIAAAVFAALSAVQALLYVWYRLYLPDELPGWFYIVLDAAFVLLTAALLHVMLHDMLVYIPQTRRIALQKRGYIVTEPLSAFARAHAQNINFLSRSAGAGIEKRYVNESFSAKLINDVSHALRAPLQTVAQNVQKLEDGGLTAQQEQEYVRQINTLSRELKKTIEDLIRISKATTGNLPFDPIETDACMMISQAEGEFYEHFEAHHIVPVVEPCAGPVMILADEQYMWYVFEGILSVMLEYALPETRLHMSASAAGAHAILRFRCTVKPDTHLQMHELSGMGFASAKAFTVLQDGEMTEGLSQDTLTVALRFPAAGQQKDTKSSN